MSQDEDVFSQADALMRRHRSFLARGSDHALEEAAPPANRTDDADIPLLTEVVELTAPPPAALKLPHLPPALEAALERWLAETLPQHIRQEMDKLGEQLLADLSDAARASLLPQLLTALAVERDKA